MASKAENLFKVQSGEDCTCALTEKECGCGNICSRCCIPAAASGTNWTTDKNSIQ